MNSVNYHLIATCHFGLESALKRELADLACPVTGVVDGHVSFMGDAAAIARANMSLRTAERVLLRVGEPFRATTWDELFEGAKSLPWEEFIPPDARFWVKKASVARGVLYSPSDIQSIVKKAAIEHLKASYHQTVFAEDGESYPLRVLIIKDEVTVALDTTGESLHKRGYRTAAEDAPIAENLAAGLIMLTPWRPRRILVDPFCGSGTIPIEAAMMAASIAPGLTRDFTGQHWENIVPDSVWRDCREALAARVRTDIDTDIQGYDSDARSIEDARANARRAGVESLIHFQQRDISELSHSGHYGFILTNPPYGERMQDEDLPEIYGMLGERFRALPDWSLYMITAYADAENCIGRKADRNRKIYNGMIKTYFYQFEGPKPPRRS